MEFPRLDHSIIAAPMGGGPSTPQLAAAVSNAGGLGFLAAGYKSAAATSEDIGTLRRLTSAPFGLNVFVPSRPPIDEQALMRYAARLHPEAERYGTNVGEQRWTDDEWDAKLAVVREQGVPIVSFTFGCPPGSVVEDLHAGTTAVWCTVTGPEEAIMARDAGVDALVVQGAEAGAHRGSFNDADGEGIALLPLLRLVASAVDLPLVAAGGIADGAGVAAVLAAGAQAAQIGTAFLRCPEAGTSAVHRQALTRGGRTATTRAFTGRSARGIVNRFMSEHGGEAPSAYPHVHYMTAPLRAAAREKGDPDGVNLWAGQAFVLAEEAPAADLVQKWSADARAALAGAQGRWGDGAGRERGHPDGGIN
jgi:nitronate monooxygenase